MDQGKTWTGLQLEFIGVKLPPPEEGKTWNGMGTADGGKTRKGSATGMDWGKTWNGVYQEWTGVKPRLDLGLEWIGVKPAPLGGWKNSEWIHPGTDWGSNSAQGGVKPGLDPHQEWSGGETKPQGGKTWPGFMQEKEQGQNLAQGGGGGKTWGRSSSGVDSDKSWPWAGGKTWPGFTQGMEQGAKLGVCEGG